MSAITTTSNGRAITPGQRLAGGFWNSTWRGTCGGEAAVIKRYRRHGAIYHVEAQALETLRVHLPLTPRVFHWDTTQLVMEDKGSHQVTRWDELGRDLAHLHQIKSNSYGWDHDNFIGMRPVDQCRTADCHAYYLHQRYTPLVDDALAKGHLPPPDAERIRAATAIFKRWGGETGPCLVHGDCWPGNVIGDADGRGVLIDPCLHAGTPYEDLYNLVMWGRVPEPFWRAYQEVRPLRRGWEVETAILQVYHLLDILCYVGRAPWLVPWIGRALDQAERAVG